MPRPEDYIGIREWGKYMGSFPYYIEEQQKKAAAANAPLDALNEQWEAGSKGVGPSGKWTTVGDLPAHSQFRAIYERAIHQAGVKGKD